MEESRLRTAHQPEPSARQLSPLDVQLTNIKNFHDESFLYIEQGLSCDEGGQKEQAIYLYKKGLHCIDQAAEISQSCPDCSSAQWRETKTLLNKMEKSKVQIQHRMQDILNTDVAAARAVADPPPTYETATTPSMEPPDMSWADNLMNDQISQSRRSSLGAVDGHELFVIPDNVQIFFITPEGYVSAPSYPGSLGIYTLENEAAATSHETPPAFLQVGDWNYPLLPGRSPMLRADWGAYIFPDVESDQEGAAVGVIIPDTVSDGEKAILEDIFANFTAAHTESEVVEAMKQLPAPPGVEVRSERQTPAAPGEQAMDVDDENRTSSKISKGIVTAAEWVAWGLEKGAEKTGVLLKKGSTQLRKKIKPNERPTEVSQDTQVGIHYARKATQGAVKVSAFIVDGLGKATMAVARQVAPHLRKQGEKVLPDSVVNKSNGGRSTVDNVMEVAAGGLVGFGTVYMGLEAAAKNLAKNLADETVSVVQHKYGRDVGKATENALYATGNIGLTVNNARSLGIKAIAKRTAKDTGKAVLEDFHNAREDKVVPARPPPPKTSQAKPSEQTSETAKAGVKRKQLPPSS